VDGKALRRAKGRWAVGLRGGQRVGRGTTGLALWFSAKSPDQSNEIHRHSRVVLRALERAAGIVTIDALGLPEEHCPGDPRGRRPV